MGWSMTDLERELLAALENIIDGGDMIESNPDEWARCFLCGGVYNDYTNTCKHDFDCPIHAARAAIAKAKEHK